MRFAADSLKTSTRIALGYALAGSAYILGSDRAFVWLPQEIASYQYFQTLKGLAFIQLTALALWIVLRRALRHKDAAMRQLQQAEDRLRLTLTASGGFLWQARRAPGGLVLTTTGGLARRLGLERAEGLSAAALTAACHPADRAGLTAFLGDLGHPTEDHPPELICRLGQPETGWTWVKLVTETATGQEASGAGFDISDLRDAAQDLAEVIASAEIGTWRMDLVTGINVVNERWAELIGHTRTELGPITTEVWRALVHPEDLARLDRRTAQEAQHPGYFFSEEIRLRHRDGHWVWILSRGRTVEFDAAGQARVLSGVHLDISRRKALEVALRRERDFLQGLADTSGSALIAVDESGIVVFANQAAEVIFGAPVDVMIGRRFDDPAWQPETLEGVPLSVEDFPYSRVIGQGATVRDQRMRFIGIDGRLRAISMNAAAMLSDTGTRRVVCSTIDITEQLAAEDALRETAAEALHAAQHDHMTGLPNRSFFDAHLTEALVKAQDEGSSLALIFLDIDNFKQTNDRFGHHQGDALIRKVAARLEGLRRPDQLIARVSGDEFTCLCPCLTPQDLPALLAQLNAAFDQPFDLGGREVFASASLGVAVFPLDATEAADLWRSADLAMHEAKARGRNQVARYSGRLRDRLDREARIAQVLQRALRDRAFRLVLQPVVALAQPGRITGAEVLLRCTDPDLTGIGPDEFMPVAERHGLVRAIDLMVIEMVGAVKAQLRGLPLKLSVNLSPDSLRQPEFGPLLLARLQTAGLGPADVMFELTEGTVMDMTSHARDTVEALAAADFELSADDFGTGYSSLAYLHQLRLKELKIDRSFISRLGLAEGRADEIVRAIIAMAQALGLRVLAEGVETEAQAAWLGSNGCSHAQGYLFSPGLPPKDFLARYGQALAERA